MLKNLLAASLTTIALFAAGCQGTGPQHTTITGTVVANTVRGATVTIFKIDQATRGLTKLAAVTSDAKGRFEYHGGVEATGPFLVIATGGVFSDEASGAAMGL